MAAVGWLWWLIGLGFAVDALRRPGEEWLEADRQKGYWVALLAIFSVFAVVPYVIGVLPRLVRASGASAGARFRRG